MINSLLPPNVTRAMSKRGYDLIEDNFVGRGGVAYIFKQKSPSGKPLAIKIAKKPGKNHSFYIRNEAKVLAELDHPFILESYGFDTVLNHSFLVTEYVNAYDICRIMLQHGKVPLFRALFVVEKVAQALSHVHETGLVHGDVKPENILWRGDIIKLLDFSFARPQGQRLGKETPCKLTGTQGFVPDSRRESGRPPLKSDDIFALGVTLYEMLAGDQDHENLGACITMLELSCFTEIPEAFRESVMNSVRLLLFLMTGTGPYPENPFVSCSQVLTAIEGINKKVGEIAGQSLL